MRTKNAVSLIGMVGKDAEVKQTNGVSYARFSLATSTGGYKKQDGTEVPEKTQWHNIVAWRNLSDFAGKYVKKGMKVAVDGMIIYGEYTNQQGQKVNTVEILANDIVLMSMPQSQQAQQPTVQQPMVQPQATPVQQQAAPVQQSFATGGYQQAAQPVQQPQAQNNAQQGGYQEPFPPAVGSDGLPF